MSISESKDSEWAKSDYMDDISSWWKQGLFGFTLLSAVGELTIRNLVLLVNVQA